MSLVNFTNILKSTNLQIMPAINSTNYFKPKDKIVDYYDDIVNFINKNGSAVEIGHRVESLEGVWFNKSGNSSNNKINSKSDDYTVSITLFSIFGIFILCCFTSLIYCCLKKYCRNEIKNDNKDHQSNSNSKPLIYNKQDHNSQVLINNKDEPHNNFLVTDMNALEENKLNHQIA